MEINKIYNENCLETMARMPGGFIDLVVTSPPYDNLRKYNGYSFDFEAIAKELFRVVKVGGVVVWVVADATVNGSETGTSFRQALFFMECGFRLFDTMIWVKTNPTPTDPRVGRYTSSFEYMFVFSKDAPKSHDLQTTKCVSAGSSRGNSSPGQLKGDGTQRVDRIAKRKGQKTKDTKILQNVWSYPVLVNNNGHPAAFPEQLAKDHILSWSNEGDLVYDCFGGSGTTAKMSHEFKRNWILSEISSEYAALAQKRIDPYLNQLKLF